MTEDDLKLAREMVRAHGPFVGNIGVMSENITKLVAQAISDGRQQGLLLASQIIVNHLEKSN